MSLKYEPASGPLHISVKQLFSNWNTQGMVESDVMVLLADPSH